MVAAVLSSAMFFSCTDTSSIEKDIDELKAAVAELQRQCSTFNASLETLDQVMSVLKDRDFVTSVQTLKGTDGTVTGYVITFVNHPTITIWMQQRQETPPSEDSPAIPVISVAKGDDGLYYWTSDGEFILDEEGNKVSAGVDGKTPQLKIENDAWYVSYDGGDTWDYLAEVSVPEVPGYVFTEVDTSDPSEVVLTLADGQTITLPAAYGSLVTLSVSDPSVSHNPGDVITLNFSALKKVSVVVDDSDVQTSEVIADDQNSGTIKIQTRPDVSLTKQRAFIIFTIDGMVETDWRMLSFDSSSKAYVTDIK